MGCCDSVAQATVTNKIGSAFTYYNEPDVWAQGSLSAFKYETNFYNKVVNWRNFLNARSPSWLSPYLVSVSSLGAQVCRNDGCVSQHNYGTKFDLSAIRWHDGFSVIRTWTAMNYPNDRKFYLGIEASCHYYFRWVLNYNFNTAHRNHIHFDGYAPSFSTTAATQVSTCRHR